MRDESKISIAKVIEKLVKRENASEQEIQHICNTFHIQRKDFKLMILSSL